MNLNDEADLLWRLTRGENRRSDGTNIREKLVLYSVVRHLMPDRVIEVGVSAGGATAWIAAALSANGRGVLDAVDDWSKSDGGLADGPGRAEHRLTVYSLNSVVRFHSEDSHSWWRKQDADSAGVAWVDGDHSFEGAKDDLHHALRVATDLVVFHDTNHLDGPREVAKMMESRGVLMQENRGFLFLNPRTNHG